MREWMNLIVNKSHLFYGVDKLRFRLDDNVWRVENQLAANRSYLKDIVKESSDSNLLFHSDPKAIVKIVWIQNGTVDGFALVDEEHREHVWLAFGTRIPLIPFHYVSIFYFDYSPLDIPKSPSSPLVKSDLYDHLFNPRSE